MFLLKTKRERKKVSISHSIDNGRTDAGEYHVSIHSHMQTTVKEYVLFSTEKTFYIWEFIIKRLHI